MTRRALLFAAVAAPPASGAPTSDADLNEFAVQYNAYVAALRGGRVDLKQWPRVVRAWRKLSPSDQTHAQ